MPAASASFRRHRDRETPKDTAVHHERLGRHKTAARRHYRSRNPSTPFTLKTTTDGTKRRVTVDVDEQAFRCLYAAFAEAFRW